MVPVKAKRWPRRFSLPLCAQARGQPCSAQPTRARFVSCAETHTPHLKSLLQWAAHLRPRARAMRAGGLSARTVAVARLRAARRAGLVRFRSKLWKVVDAAERLLYARVRLRPAHGSPAVAPRSVRSGARIPLDPLCKAPQDSFRRLLPSSALYGRWRDHASQGAPWGPCSHGGARRSDRPGPRGPSIACTHWPGLQQKFELAQEQKLSRGRPCTVNLPCLLQHARCRRCICCPPARRAQAVAVARHGKQDSGQDLAWKLARRITRASSNSLLETLHAKPAHVEGPDKQPRAEGLGCFGFACKRLPWLAAALIIRARPDTKTEAHTSALHSSHPFETRARRRAQSKLQTLALTGCAPVCWSGRAMAPRRATLVAPARRCSRMTVLPMKFRGVDHVRMVRPAAHRKRSQPACRHHASTGCLHACACCAQERPHAKARMRTSSR